MNPPFWNQDLVHWWVLFHGVSLALLIGSGLCIFILFNFPLNSERHRNLAFVVLKGIFIWKHHCVDSEQYWSVCPIRIEKCSKVAAASTRLFLPWLLASQHTQTPWYWVWASTALLSVSAVLPLANRACLLHAVPQAWETQTVARTACSSRWGSTNAGLLFLSDSSQGWGSWPYAFFLSYLVRWRFFLQLWLCRSSSVSFQLVFHENCYSVYRCIFDMSGGKGERHVLSFAILSPLLDNL